MITSQRIAAAALSAAVIASPLATVSAAHAAAPAKHWHTIKKWNGAKQQACKKPVRQGKAFKIYTRLVNGHESPIGAGIMVVKDGQPVDRWATKDLVPEGKTSKTGSVVLPKDPTYTIEAFQYEGQMGDGGPVKLKRIGRC